MTRKKLTARIGALTLAAAFAATPLAYADYEDAIDMKQHEYYGGYHERPNHPDNPDYPYYPNYPYWPNVPSTPSDVVPSYPLYPSYPTYPDEPEQSASLELYVNGSRVSQSPYYQSGVLMLPLRVIAEKGGYSVSYSSGVVTLRKSNKTIKLTIGKNAYPHGSKTEYLETAPAIKNGTTYVPKSFVSGILGYKVSSSSYGRFSVKTTSSSAAGDDDASTYPVYVNGRRAGTAHYSGSTLMLPLRSVSTALGYRYSYSSRNRYSTLTAGNEKLRVYWDDNSYPVNGRNVALERRPQLRSGTVYVPASFATRALGCEMTVTSGGRVKLTY